MLTWSSRVAIVVLGLSGLCFGQQRTPRGRTNGSPTGGRGVAAASDPTAPKGIYPTSRGVLKSISGSQLLVEVDDEHEMKFRITRKTRIFVSQGKQSSQEVKASALHPGQVVTIDMQSGLDGSFEAIRITLESPKQ